jgi:hypothetical protein
MMVVRMISLKDNKTKLDIEDRLGAVNSSNSKKQEDMKRQVLLMAID